MLDRRERVIENLDFIKRSYVKLVILKEREREANENRNYEFLYELSESERMLIEDINGCLKYIVPDLILLREDKRIREKITEIDEFHEAVITESLHIRNCLEKTISETVTKLDNITVFPKTQTTQVSHIVNIRA